jgi:hypothetical protein
MTDFLPRLLLIGAICAALVGAGAVGASKYYAPRLKALQSDFDQFRGGVEALGKAAAQKAKETDEANRKRKETADAQAVKAKRDLDGLYAAYVGLRDSKRNAGSGVLPETPGTSGDPDRICFSRSGLDRGLDEALGLLRSGSAPILRRGDEAVTGLKLAREWAAGVH